MKSIRSIFLGGAALALSGYFVHAQTNESVVNWEADVAGLSVLSAGDVPRSGTFWLVTPPDGGNGGAMPPYPCLPSGFEGGNIYTLPGGAFLVDATGGNDGTNSLQLAAQILSVSNIIQQSETVATSRDLGMRALDLSGPPGFNDTNGDGYTPDGVTNIPIDFGTNLWISQWNLTSGGITGIVSNTQPGIFYILQTNADLTTTNWGNTGLSFSGSATTNWTPLPAWPVSLTNNLFFRLQSQFSTGDSGIPDWWELQNFDAVGLNVNAPDGADDGWTIYQKYVLGVNPNTFYTPPAPQGLTATYNISTTTANISWLPSPGDVTGYTLTTPGGTVNLSATATSYADIDPNIATSLNSIFSSYPTSFNLVADYASGPSAAASAQLQTSQAGVWLVQGAQGSNFLAAAISALPPGTAAIRLEYNPFQLGATLLISNDLPLTGFINGLYYLPPELTTLVGLSNNLGVWYAQTVNSNSTPTSQRVTIGYMYGATSGLILNPNNNAPITPVYLDGRVQLKQNLKFLLRAATVDNSFGYNYAGPDGVYPPAATAFPINYAEASFFQPVYAFGAGYDTNNPPTLNPLQPFQDNYLYKNCVFDPANLTGGELATGVFPGGPWAVGDDYMVLAPNLTYTFNPPTVSGTAIPALGPDQATWLMTGENTFNPDYFYEIGIDNGDFDGYESYSNTNTMLANAKNIYGLPFLSVELAWDNGGGGSSTQTLAPGDSTTQSEWFYPQTAQPQLQTVAYDFWNFGYWVNNDNNWDQADLLPEDAGFEPTNQSDNCLIAPLGGTLQVAGYAKMAVQNGYPGVYGYLGQYFTNAYAIDTNGVVTTNTTGILSPYGAFFPTQPGPAALVTMPDPDTGQQGTCTVYAVSLALDKNHDGTMDLSLFGADATSQNSPFVFWANDNFDRWDYDADDATNYMDDVADNYPTALGANGQPVPDCNYLNPLGQRAIPTTRDLEDYARLWVCGVTSNLLANLPAGSTVTLNWGDMGNPNTANPTIDLFQATDPDGGIEYLTNETSAVFQANLFNTGYVGRLAPGGSLTLNSYQFANNWAGNHFIWCGVANGGGQLNLTIADANGNVLAQTSAYLQIMDIKQMYERWTVGDILTAAPTNVASLATDNLPASLQANPVAFQYPPPTDTNTPYILFVHGWNMESWEKDRFAETAYKRLYWQGYQGRFGEFRWPTGNGFAGWSSAITDPDNFDASESNAWASATGLLNKLTELNNEYPGNVYLLAHSMGNVVAGEALRLAGNNQVANTYIAMQGAIAAHAYDPTTLVRTNDFNYLGIGYNSHAPNYYASYWTNGAPSYFSDTAGAGSYINFFNIEDYALARWQVDQDFKPALTAGYSYNNYTGQFIFTQGTSRALGFPADTYQIFSYCDTAFCYALGAQENVGGAFDQNAQIDLFLSPYNFGSLHVGHSYEFRLDYTQSHFFWNNLLENLRL